MKIKNENKKLTAMPISANLAGSYIRRSMRRGSDYVEDSFEAECRDAIVAIKPFLITRMRVSRAVRKALRDTANKYIRSHIKIRTTKELFSEIIANKLQRGMAVKLKKIYPLALSEIRVFEIKREKSPEEIKQEKEAKNADDNEEKTEEEIKENKDINEAEEQISEVENIKSE